MSNLAGVVANQSPVAASRRPAAKRSRSVAPTSRQSSNRWKTRPHFSCGMRLRGERTFKPLISQGPNSCSPRASQRRVRLRRSLFQSNWSRQQRASACQSRYALSSPARVRPNPSLERTSTGMALGPPGRAVYHRPGGPSARPAAARSAQTLGSKKHRRVIHSS